MPIIGPAEERGMLEAAADMSSGVSSIAIIDISTAMLEAFPLDHFARGYRKYVHKGLTPLK